MKNYTITVNGNVYDVVVEEGTTSGVVRPAAPVAPKAAPAAAPAAAPKAAGAAGGIKIEAGVCGILGGMLGRKLNKKMSSENVKVLFLITMAVIILLSIKNLVYYLG